MKSVRASCILFLALIISSSTVRAESVWWHIKETAVGAFDKTGLEILGVGALATTIAFNNDTEMHDAWVNHQKMSAGAASVGNFWGQGYVQGAMALAQVILDRPHGIPSAEGLIYSTTVTGILKTATKRPRPDSTTETSFPSGHTQISFSSATTIGESYGWLISAPFYGMGVFTGLSRIADDAHWLSDVVAGATVGIMFGRAGFAHHFQVTPMTIDDGGQGFGLLATWDF